MKINFGKIKEGTLGKLKKLVVGASLLATPAVVTAQITNPDVNHKNKIHAKMPEQENILTSQDVYKLTNEGKWPKTELSREIAVRHNGSSCPPFIPEDIRFMSGNSDSPRRNTCGYEFNYQKNGAAQFKYKLEFQGEDGQWYHVEPSGIKASDGDLKFNSTEHNLLNTNNIVVGTVSIYPNNGN